MNLLAGTAHPEELLTPDLQHSVRWYAENVDEMLRPLRVSRTSLTEVRLTIRFEDFADHEACYVCVVDATDDRGRNHSVRLDGRTPWTRSE